MIGVVLFALLALIIGYPAYRKRWPDGLWPADNDTERLDRIRRVGRRRVLPLPLGGEGEHRGHRHRGRR